MSEENLEMWNRHCTTKPSDTGRMKHGAKLTSISAQSQTKEATIEFGVHGIGWGLRDCNYYKFEESLVLECVFYAKTELGEIVIEMAADIKYRDGGDCFKKVRTQCQSKALSKLGFASDVFEGKFDDASYVAEAEDFERIDNGLSVISGATTIERLGELEAFIEGQSNQIREPLTDALEAKRKELEAA